MCPHCKHTLRAYDLIPVISWIVLRGKCRDCGKPISVQYPLVELLTGVLFALTYWYIRPSSPAGWLELAFWLYAITALVILSVYDFKWMILPDKVLIPLIVIAGLRLALMLSTGQPLSMVRGPVIAAVAAGGVFYTMAAVSKGKWMGGGDIKLVFLIGLMLGIRKGILALFLATTVAAIIGGSLMIARKLKNRYIPFGPFLAAATVYSFLFGDRLINWYLKLSGIIYLTNP